MAKLANNRVFRFLVELVRRYFVDNVSKSGAQFAYFFLFSFFPLLIFINSLIGILQIDTNGLPAILDGVIPHDISNLVNEYLAYLGSINSTGLMFTGLTLTLYFLAKAVNSLIYSINGVFKVSRRRHPIIQLLLAVVFTALLMFSIFITLVLLIFGRTVLTFISGFINISYASVLVWHFLRFAIIAAYSLAILTLVYIIMPNTKVTIKSALPGASFAMLAWVFVSIGFSFYVENMGRYSLLYGSIGAIIVLMLWLYLTGIILILGAEVNHIILEMKRTDALTSRRKSVLSEWDNIK